MALNNLKIKLIRTENQGSLAPQISLSYGIKPGQLNSNTGYDILSVLKGENDVLIEVNSSLAYELKDQSKNSPEEFLSDVRALNLEYSYRKIHWPKKQNAFSFLFGDKKEEQDGHEIFAYIPDEIWKSENFYKILPDYGVRYYIMNGSGEAREVLEHMTRMQDHEKLAYFKLIVFHVSSFCQMGISSNPLKLEEIKALFETGK